MGLLKILAISIALWTSDVYSNTDKFKERFILSRDTNGQLVEVIDKSLSMGISFDSYIKAVVSDLKEYQSNLAFTPGFRETILTAYEDQAFLNNERSSRNIKIIDQALTELQKVDIDKIVENKAFKTIMNAFEERLKGALAQVNPNVLANVVDRRYFYKRHVGYQVVKWGLGFAKKRLSSIPVLNTVSYLMVEIEKKVRERRSYHQNMLLHYLNNFEAKELGLTDVEVDHIFSSIYESRIAWWGILESNKANETWDTYGTDSFYAAFRLASKRLIKYRSIYSSVDERLNYSFQKVTFEGEEVIINLFNDENTFNSKPAIAFYVNQPRKIMQNRLLLTLGQFGLSFVPLPSAIKSSVEIYLKSFHEGQKINEGSLYAHFESNEDSVMMNNLKLQYGNPFDLLKL